MSYGERKEMESNDKKDKRKQIRGGEAHLAIASSDLLNQRVQGLRMSVAK